LRTSSNNFAFLEAHAAQLIRLTALAAHYFPTDANTCLFKLRQFAELLAQDVAARAGLYTSFEEPFTELLGRLSRSGYGTAERPEDFLDAFTRFVKENVNQIAALKIVVQRPRELTREQLRELRLELDAKGFTDAKLRRAWADAKNQDIAASIIGYVRQAALGDPLIPYDRCN